MVFLGSMGSRSYTSGKLLGPMRLPFCQTALPFATVGMVLSACGRWVVGHGGGGRKISSGKKGIHAQTLRLDRIVSGQCTLAVDHSGLPGGFGSRSPSLGTLTMASQRQIDANRLNSMKSTGPKTPEGLEKSSMNAIVHGLRSKRIARAREDSYAFENRRVKWMASADASDDREEFLVYLSVCQSFEIEHAQRAQVERVTSLIEDHDENELEEVYRLGKRLFFDPAGPTPLYGIDPDYQAKKKKTSWNGESVETNDPAVLLATLEKSWLGCTWLRFRWLELEARAETSYWQGLDRLKAVRLLGLQPIAALEDERVAKIFVASDAIYAIGEHEFVELGAK